MLQVTQEPSIDEAGRSLLAFILQPKHWVSLASLGRDPQARPGNNPAYQRQIGRLRVCASVDITDDLDVFLRVGFTSPGLTPTKAAEHLEGLVKGTLPFIPNSEWQVEIDQGKTIHFIRRYAAGALQG